MCGRYLITSPVEALREAFGFDDRLNLAASYNVAPTHDVPTVRLLDGQRHLSMLRWGLIPFWAKDTKAAARAINARAETVASKPTFREAFAKRRCLLLADGYYEWRKEGDAKQAMLIRRKDHAPFAFAGLWERWRSKDETAQVIESCTIITTAASEALCTIHARAPVVLPPELQVQWLTPGSPADIALPAPDGDEFYATAVSNHVNRVQNNDPECIVPIA